ANATPLAATRSAKPRPPTNRDHVYTLQHRLRPPLVVEVRLQVAKGYIHYVTVGVGEGGLRRGRRGRRSACCYGPCDGGGCADGLVGRLPVGRWWRSSSARLSRNGVEWLLLRLRASDPARVYQLLTEGEET
ncbi:unnamed protein product, partial [Musa banksii]